MIALSRLLKLQWAYIIIGVGYNIVNYMVLSLGGPQLSTTDPKIGSIAMISYGLYLIPAYIGWIKLYRALMVPAILIYGWAGVGLHIVKYLKDPLLYPSFIGWFLAVGINSFGLMLAMVALSGRFIEDRKG